MIKINITKNGINRSHILHEVIHPQEHITYVVFLPKMHNLNQVMNKYEEKYKLIATIKNLIVHSSKMSML